MCWRSRTPGVTGGNFRRWLRIDDSTVGPSNKQLHLISGEFFCGTDLLRRSPSERRQEESEVMEGLKALQPDTSSPAFEIQGTQKNTTRPNSSGKLLQLTPLWEYVIKNQRIPPEIDKDMLFAEFAARLSDLEWEVRGHSLRVLVDLIPVMELSELDRYMMPVLLRELTYNLGHSAPSVRKGALDTLGVYLNQSTDPETVLRNIVVEGLEKQTSGSVAKGNIAMGVILSIPSLVSPLLTPTNGIVLISQTGLIHLVSALSKKLVHDTYQEQSLKTLVRIREMVGETRFDRFLEGFHPQCKKDFDILCQVYDVRMHLGDSGIDLHVPPPAEDSFLKGNSLDSSNSGHGYWSDGSTPPLGATSSSIMSPEDALLRDQNQNLIFLGDKSGSSENIVDSPSPKDDATGNVDVMNQVDRFSTEDIENCERDNSYGGVGIIDNNECGNYREVYSEKNAGIQGIIADRRYTDENEELEVEIDERAVSLLAHKEDTNETLTVMAGDALDDDVLHFSRVILETEIKFNEDAAIMMTILEEGNRSPEEKFFHGETALADQGEETEYAEGSGTGVDNEGYRVYNNDFVMKVLTDDEDYNDDDDVAVSDQPVRRTPRRVRFGGEMVMMRTPDSEETTVEQQDGDGNPPQDSEDGEVSGGRIISQDDHLDEIAVNSAVRVITPDTAGDANVCRKENLLRESSRRESISQATDGDMLRESRRQSMVHGRQDRLGDLRQDMLEEPRRDSVEFVKQDMVLDVRRDLLDGKRQDSLESLQRGSGANAKQEFIETAPLCAPGDGTGRPSMQDCSENTRQDAVENGRSVSEQDLRLESVEDKRNVSVQDTRQDSLESGRKRKAKLTKQRSVEDTRQEQGETTRGITEVAGGDVGQKDKRMSSVLQSQIPLPIIPARNKPKRPNSLYRQKPLYSEISADMQEQSSDQAAVKRSSRESVKGFEGSVPQTSGTSERTEGYGDAKDDVAGQEYPGQNWEELGIVTESVLEDLHDQEEWVSRIHGIESLSTALRDPEVLQTVLPSMPSLLHCLMVTMAEDRSYRVATSSIGAMRGLITSLPHAVLQDHLPQIVVGLAGHIGGSGCVNLKIETVQAAKALMQIMKPNSVVEVLLSSDCIGAKSSKMRENSLLFLIYATLTFPSTEFHWDQMAGPVAAAVADPRRRVRQAALDALSVIAQFATPSLLDGAVKVVADRQPNLLIRTAYLAGVQARLARRQLPTTSPDGLILYVPQIPSARKGGFSGTPIGSDVEWVLAGSGSVSSGSARSRGQLIAAQRLDPRATLSPKGDNSSVAPVKKGNPWTDRKEVVASGVGAQQLAPIDPEKSQDEQRPRFGVSSWTSDLDASQNGISSSQGTFRPLYLRFQSPPDIDNLNNDSVEKGSFSLLPNRLSESTVSSRGSQGVGREKLSQTWPPPSSGCHSPQIPNTSSKRGRRILEPLNTTSPHDGSPHRGVSPARRVSPAHRGTSPTPSAILPMPRGMSPLPVGVNSGVRHKIPPLSPRKKKDWVADSGFGITANGKNDRVVDSTSVKKNRRRKHSTNKGKEIVAIQHNSSPPDEDQAKLSSNFKGEAADDCTIPQKPVLARQGVRHDLSPAGMFPENGSKIPSGLFTPPAEPFLPPVDPSTPQLSRIKTSPVPQEQDDLEFKSFDETDEAGREDSPSHAMASSTVSAMDALEAEERALKFQLLKEQEQLESVTVSPVPIISAPPTIESPVITTEVIELDTNSRGGVLSLHNLQFSPPILTHEESAEDVNNEHQVPQATYSTGSVIDLHLNVEDNFQNETVAPIKQTRRIKHQVGPKIPATTLRGTQFRDRTRTQQNSGLFPDTLHPVDKPKEALQQCFMYLDNSEWEVTLQGLKLLMRLMRHHPETIHIQLHSVIVAVGKQVRNLRSQVARAACQASGELFLSQKRALETDLDELVSSLLHRTADTNRFLRADSNAALDKMIEVISPSRAVAVITGKGISHQNAIVRTASARLLVSLVSKIGVDKVMSHSGDMRDKILIAGSNLLTEGSLDTRCFAKQLFRMLSTHPTFSPVLSEVIPSHILRNISKTLQSLK